MDQAPPKPPPLPWLKGPQDGYSTVSLVVDVVQDSSGCVFSTHRLESPLDHETAMKWPGGGQEQVAFALLVEAARREAVLGLLLMLSKEPLLLTALQSSEDKQQDTVSVMAKAIRAQFDRTLTRISESVAREALNEALKLSGT